MKNFLTSLTFLLLSLISLSQEIKFTGVATPDILTVGQRFKLVYTINASGSNFKSPDLSDFNVFSGPNQSSNIQMINGSFTQSLSYYYILSPKQEGKFTIEPATMQVGNGRLSSNAVTVKVSKGNSNANAAQNNNPQQPAPQSESLENKLFIRAIVNKTDASLSEGITVTYKIYSKFNQINFSDLKFPTFNGFYTEDIPMGKNDKLEVEQYNGSNWYSAELKKSLLFPQKSGKLEIPSLEAVCLVRERAQSRSIFDQFFGGGYRDVQVKVKSAKKTINVSAHPKSGKPADFKGAVGDFDFEGTVDKNSVNAGDAINFNFKISGKGNLKLIEAPDLDFPSEFETYDAEVKDKISISDAGMSGSRSFNYLLIPRAGGEYSLGPFTYSYFDPRKSEYQSVTIPEQRIIVKKTDGAQPSINRSGSGLAPKKLAEDIRFIKVNADHLEPVSKKPFFLSTLFYVLSALPAIVLSLLLIIRQRGLYRQQNLGVFKRREAGGVAQKRLKTAGDLLSKNKKEAFYEEVFKALYGYSSDKLLIPTASLNKSEIAKALKTKSVPEEDIQELERILQRCEFARYAPGDASGMNEIFTEAKSLISKLEKYLKK